jgi:hypothetical protein
MGRGARLSLPRREERYLSESIGGQHGPFVDGAASFGDEPQTSLLSLAAARLEKRAAVPIYEYYCPNNNRIYQFFAKTVAQGKQTPKCPDNPAFRMERVMSSFAITGGGKPESEKSTGEGETGDGGADDADDPRMESAFEQLEQEMEGVDENDPKAMGRMMRRMSELTGEKLDGEMEEVVRKLEEGQDPEALEDQLGDAFPDDGAAAEGGLGRRRAPTRDPNLYDYD